MPNQVSSLTPMQVCAIELIKEEGPINPNQLASHWHFKKTGRYPPCASRDRFGLTSNAYQALRKLVDKGLVLADRSNYTYSLKN